MNLTGPLRSALADPEALYLRYFCRVRWVKARGPRRKQASIRRLRLDPFIHIWDTERGLAMSTLTLTSDDVERLVDWQGLLDALERVHRGLAMGRAVQPVPHPLRDPDDTGIEPAAVVPMMSLDAENDLFAVKVLADAPRNREKGRPAQRSTISLYSAATGECLAIVDGRALTRIRTAAATTMATRALARPDSRTFSLLGSGALAVEHARALARAFPVESIRVWSRSEENARAAVERLRTLGVPADPADSIERALRGADVVCTLTPSNAPILTADVVRPGLHINAVGSPPRPAFSEVAPGVFSLAAVVAVDSRDVGWCDSGNLRNAHTAGTLARDAVVEIGEVLEGVVPGRTDDAQVTIFNSVGIGLQDLAAVDHVRLRAVGAGAGTMVSIRE